MNDFQPGRVFQHWPGKTITESDNNLFCLLTMNNNPLHLDEEYAGKSQFGKIVVAGTYVISLVIGMSMPDISGSAIANLEYEKIVHENPVFIGDTIYARSEILEVKSSDSKPDRGVITVETEAYNQRNEKVLTLRRKVMIPKTPALDFGL